MSVWSLDVGICSWEMLVWVFLKYGFLELRKEHILHLLR